MRRIFTLFLLLWLILALSHPSLAATLGPSRKLAENEVLRGRFSQEHYMKSVDKPVHSEGRFVIAPSHGVIWAIEKPFPLTITVTPEGMVQGLGDVPVLRQSPAQFPYLSHVTDMIGNALGGNLKALESDFKMTESGTAKKWKVKFTPRNREALKLPFLSITAKGGQHVDEAELIRPSGYADVFRFTNQSISSSPLTEVEKKAFETVKAGP